MIGFALHGSRREGNEGTHGERIDPRQAEFNASKLQRSMAASVKIRKRLSGTLPQVHVVKVVSLCIDGVNATPYFDGLSLSARNLSIGVIPAWTLTVCCIWSTESWYGHGG